MAKIKSKKLDAKARIALYETIKEHLEPSAKPGLFKYKNGFSDKQIAAIAGVTTMQVIGIRSSLIGKLEIQEGQTPYVPIPRIIERVTALEKQVEDLIRSLGG